MLEACIDEDLAHEKGLHLMVYVVFSYWQKNYVKLGLS